MALAGPLCALWGCVPVTQLPPPVPMAKGDEAMIGAALVGGAWDTTNQERPTSATFISVQGFKMVPLTDRWNLGGTAFLGSHESGGIGAFARLDLVEGDRLYLGAQAGGGFLYAALGLPVGFAVTDSLWLYTHPAVVPLSFNRYGYTRRAAQPHLPLGIWWRADDTLSLGVELGTTATVNEYEARSFTPYVAVSLARSPRPKEREP